MKLIELQNFLNNLPLEMKDFKLVNGEFIVNEDKTIYRIDKVLTTVYVDEVEQTICLLNQSEEDIKNVIKDGNSV